MVIEYKIIEEKKVSRAYIAYIDRTNIQTNVFRTIDEAFEWLGVWLSDEEMAIS